MKYKLLSFLLSFIISQTLGQNQKNVDSLQSLLLKASPDTIKVKILNQLAYEYIYANPQEAFKHAQKALQISEKSNYDKGIAEAYRRIGNVHSMQGSLPEALYYYFKALHIYETLHESQGIADALGNIGLTYSMLGNEDQALEYYFKAVKLLKTLNNQNRLANAYNNIGSSYQKKRENKNAMKYYLEAILIREKINDKRGLAATLHNIGELYVSEKHIDSVQKALPYLKKSSKISKAIGNQQALSSSYQLMAEIYLMNKHITEAKELATEALAIAQKARLKGEIRNVYATLAKIYAQELAFEKAYAYQGLFIAYKDSIMNEKTEKQILSYRLAYENEKKQAEISLIKKNNQIKQIIFLAGIVLILVVASILLQNYIKQKKINHMLLEQKEQIQMQHEELSQQSEEILAQRDYIEEKNKELALHNNLITQSLRYASTIQNALLPTEQELSQLFADYFIVFKPRDIVSGDFYWVTTINNEIFLAVVDCTGHGVPGAFMSMLGNSFLSEIVKETQSPAEMLEQLHIKIRKALKQDEHENRDGMDIALCKLAYIHSEEIILTFAGAKRTLYYFHKQQLSELAGNRRSIGGMQVEEGYNFQEQSITLKKGDLIYLSTDGFTDNANPKREKFGVQRFRNLLQSIAHLPISQQASEVLASLEAFQQNTPQRDDILTMGIRI